MFMCSVAMSTFVGATVEEKESSPRHVFPGGVRTGPSACTQLDLHAPDGAQVWCATCLEGSDPCVCSATPDDDTGTYAWRDHGRWRCDGFSSCFDHSICMPNGGVCTTNADCCTGNCDAGICGAFCVAVDTCIAPCVATGASCATTGECCLGFCGAGNVCIAPLSNPAFLLDTQDEGEPVRSEPAHAILNCVGSGIFCESNIDLGSTDIVVDTCPVVATCLVGVCPDPACPRSCIDDGGTCMHNVDCCSAHCNGVHICVAGCDGLAVACSVGTDCCSGVCDGGVCVASSTTTTTTTTTSTSTTGASTTTSTSTSTTTSTAPAMAATAMDLTSPGNIATGLGGSLVCVTGYQATGLTGATHLSAGMSGAGNCTIAVYDDGPSGALVASVTDFCPNSGGVVTGTATAFDLTGGLNYQWCVCGNSSPVYQAMYGANSSKLVNAFDTSVGQVTNTCDASAVPPATTGAYVTSVWPAPIVLAE